MDGFMVWDPFGTEGMGWMRYGAPRGAHVQRGMVSGGAN